jgi:hypothetical protein
MSDDGASTERQEISDSGLFDRDYYLRSNDDVLKSGLDALDHYCKFGWREGRRPNPYFDSAWYLEQHSDVASATMNPLLHYIRHGDREGRRPVPVFDSAWYRAAYAVSPEQLTLGHFLAHRYGGSALPSPELFFALHVAPFAEYAASGGDPFAPFASRTSAASARAIETDLVRRSGLFDENYYLLNGSDLLDVDINPISHFCTWGWQEHRKPNIYFDTAWYLGTNPKAARLSINPLLHYLFQGEAKGRRPVVYFDPLWYREKYRVSPPENALAHYLAQRRKQTVGPNPFFDPVWYMEHHGEEVGLGRDAFAHYLQAGARRNINPSPIFDAVAYRRQFLGQPSRLFASFSNPNRDNPLIHYLRRSYR